MKSLSFAANYTEQKHINKMAGISMNSLSSLAVVVDIQLLFFTAKQ